MQRLDANKLRFHIGELNGVMPNDFIWEERLLCRIARGVDFRTKQGDYLRFTTDAGRVYCDIVPHDLPNDWSIRIDEAVKKAVAAAKRVVRLKDFERFILAFQTLRYLEPFLEHWAESVRKQVIDSAQAWANAAARRVVKESLARESDGR
jgi:hypothetical protein